MFQLMPTSLNKVLSGDSTDSKFSPVRQANYTVEHTRVGQITDYDRLIFEVWTDASISAREAVGLTPRS